MSRFLKMTSLEFKRILRNKLIIIMIIIIPIIFSLICCLKWNREPMDIGLYVENCDASRYIDSLNDYSEDINVSLYEEIDTMKQDVLNGKIALSVVVYDEEGITFAKFLFDDSKFIGATYRAYINEFSTSFAYKEIKDVLNTKFGIKIKEEYFESISQESVNISKIDKSQLQIPLILPSMIGICILFGLIYITARDNESNLSRTLFYLPINKHLYLFSKITPLFVIGIIESVLIYLLFYLLFRISFAGNIFVLFLLIVLYLLATINLGIIINNVNSQVASTILSLSAILLPLFIFSMQIENVIPLVLKVILHLFPFMVYFPMESNYVFNGNLNIVSVLILLLQVIVYYFVAYYLLKNKTKKSIN